MTVICGQFVVWLFRESGCCLGPETVATLGRVRGRGPLDTSSAKQDEEDSGRDEAGKAGGSRPAPDNYRMARRSDDKKVG
ncbi:MAG: hypothetical protein IKR88_06195 [Bacteroidales bacterium]|nr:hypothetical protein [Bacteroidales bacterium]